MVLSYESIRRWCDKFGPSFAHRAKAARRKPGSTWHLDEMFVTLRGEPYVLWRAVDQHGTELDILLQNRRDKAAAKRFFKRVLADCPEAPRKIITDQLRSYPAAKAEIAELANVRHVFVRACARVNNRAENSHQPTRERERRMRGFRQPWRTQAFLSSLGTIRQHFAIKRHLLRASLYRKQLATRFDAWRLFTGLTQNPSAAFRIATPPADVATASPQRDNAGERISTGFVESAVNQVISNRFVKKQQMRWTPRGAHLLLQVRTQVLNGELRASFERWYPGFGAQDQAPLAA